MTGDIKVISPTSSIPVRVLVADIVDVISDKVLNPSNTDPRVVPQPCDGERHEEEIGSRWILRNEVALQEDLLEVTLAGIVATRLEVHRRKDIREGIAPRVRVDVYLEAPIHLFIVFKEDIPIVEHIGVIHVAS